MESSSAWTSGANPPLLRREFPPVLEGRPIPAEQQWEAKLPLLLCGACPHSWGNRGPTHHL
ncbi:hypothetical protein A2U01_0117195, partial [Trifolium medium]|nr:hypothetical protein [Trifolium medium]